MGCNMVFPCCDYYSSFDTTAKISSASKHRHHDHQDGDGWIADQSKKPTSSLQRASAS
jgi:hypothetical protein